VKHTGQEYEAIEQALERDNFMSAEDALNFGLIDKVEFARTDAAGASDTAGSDQGDSGSES
jgi:ATP-dependent Clp protease protease subunit